MHKQERVKLAAELADRKRNVVERIKLFLILLLIKCISIILKYFLRGF